MKNLFLILFFIAANNLAFAQDLIESRQTSYYTYIFKLDDQEARNIYKKNIWQVDDSYFHTIVDFFPTDSIYKKDLPAGHYLKVYTDKNKLKFHITSVQNFDVMIGRNNTDLVIQVYDNEGNIITDADVKVRWEKIRFDTVTKSYIDRKSNQKGLLQVKWKDFTAYYKLSRATNNSAFQRTGRKLVYSTPLRYVWLPVRYVMFLPVDAVKSIVYGYPEGTIRRTGYFFRQAYSKIACLFDDFYCNYYGENRFRYKHSGYMVFNKPRYLPGDTVKLKAFIVNKHGNPINNPVNVVLRKPDRNIRLNTIMPYRKGGYVYEFSIHDSLELQLDKSYIILLEKKDGKVYISESFYYEDYELSKIKLDLATESAEHHSGQLKNITVKGTDENDLNILDGRLEVFIKPGNVYKYFNDYVFIPDTLAFWNLELKKEGETEISIPDTIFPKVNMEYEVGVTLLTSDNETITERINLQYYHYKSELISELDNDSIRFAYQRNGNVISLPARIFGVDNFGNKILIDSADLPKKIEINPYYSEYLVDADTIQDKINLLTEPSLIQCYSERTRDSLQVFIKNPRNLPFSYFIYKRNNERDRGYSDSLNVKIHSASKQNYYVSIQYLWGGKLIDENYRVPYNDKSLTITVLEPKIVYPGQEATIELLVTDAEGNPVPDVDVTAYSITKKFDYTVPDIPYLGKNRKSKTVINNFSFINPFLNHYPGLDLDYKTWSILAGIDSIEYYKFIYPGNNIYRCTYDAEITQFSPFVVSEGSIKPIHVIYVDSRPVYFSWSTNTQPYSFQVDTGYHKIKLRTTDCIIELDNIFFEAGKKSIISVWDSIVHPSVSVSKQKPRLSKYEKRLLYKYIFPYRYRYGEYYGYLEQDKQVFFLKPEVSNYYSKDMAGPVFPGNTRFQLIDSFSVNFLYEPFFEYEFMPELLKMRSVDPEARYPDYLYQYQAKKGLSDEVLTEDAIVSRWKDYIEWKRYSTAKYQYPRSTSEGMGGIQLNMVNDTLPANKQPLNIIIFRYDDYEFLRIYPGNILRYYDLAKGFYKLLFFYSGSGYSIVDSLYVSPNGLNYHQIKQPVVNKKDTFSIQVSKIIEYHLFEKQRHQREEEAEIKRIYNAYMQESPFTGDGEIISGYVYDSDGSPLPGVTVQVRGINVGTISQIDGFYSLKVPKDRNELVFSFIGFMSELVSIDYRDVINVYMTEEVVALNEVVIVGYGVGIRARKAGSVSAVSSNSIQGVESNVTGMLQGKISGVTGIEPGASGSDVSIRVRGFGTVTEAEPLYIIDGVVFMGDISELNTDMILDIQILKDEQATAIYGSRAANGVVLINTGGSFKQTTSLTSPEEEYDELFMEAIAQSSSIRNNFSDYAFWNPTLLTDKEGKVSFKTQFPDDVTGWRTFYLAMNGKRQTGQTEGFIKSYKPLMAQLAVPRFLIETDTTYAIGKVIKYTGDSILLKTKFEQDGKLIMEKEQTCARSLIDTLELIAEKGDSIAVTYFLEREDGYYDGEKRYIPILPTGLEKTTGQFHTLQGDTTIVVSFDTLSENYTIYAGADVLDVIDKDISRLIEYKYSCNEQLASKLKALLSGQIISKYKGEPFRRKNQVNHMIQVLQRNQHNEGMWGWWKNSKEPSMWISLHVLEALVKAKELGYNVNIDKGRIAELLVWDLESPIDADYKLRALYILKLLNARVNFPAYINQLEKTGNINMNELFRLIELKQLCGLDFNIDTINSFRKETIFGNLYFSDDSIPLHFYTNDIQNTLIAYRVLRSDSTTDHRVELQKIRNYLFGKKAPGTWLNTYESSSIIETILPELLGSDRRISQPMLSFSGSINKTVDEFPFEITVSSRDTINITKQGDFPVYLTVYSHYWDTLPVEKKSEFEISTGFEKQNNDILKAGEPVKMIASVKVLKDADFVMINVPIPAGCSYGNKSSNLLHEVHREYFRNATVIFCEHLRSGNYKFEIELIPRYTGRYTINPAKIEMMYFPTFNANNDIRKITIN